MGSRLRWLIIMRLVIWCVIRSFLVVLAPFMGSICRFIVKAVAVIGLLLNQSVVDAIYSVS